MALTYTVYEMLPGAARQGCQLISWTLANGEMGVPFQLGAYSDYSIHARGTPGAGLNWTLFGSNMPAPLVIAEFVALTDPQGTAITKTGVDVIEQAEEITNWVTPKVTAGDVTTAVTFYLFCRR